MKKILFALMCVTALAILTGCGNKEELEAKAVPLVNKMLERELGERVKANGNTLVKCTKVDLTQKLAPRQEGTVFRRYREYKLLLHSSPHPKYAGYRYAYR